MKIAFILGRMHLALPNKFTDDRKTVTDGSFFLKRINHFVEKVTTFTNVFLGYWKIASL